MSQQVPCPILKKRCRLWLHCLLQQCQLPKLSDVQHRLVRAQFEVHLSWLVVIGYTVDVAKQCIHVRMVILGRKSYSLYAIQLTANLDQPLSHLSICISLQHILFVPGFLLLLRNKVARLRRFVL